MGRDRAGRVTERRIGIAAAIAGFLVMGVIVGTSAAAAAAGWPSGSPDSAAPDHPSCVTTLPPRFPLAGKALAILSRGGTVTLAGYRTVGGRPQPLLVTVRDGAWISRWIAGGRPGMLSAIDAAPGEDPWIVGWTMDPLPVPLVGRLVGGEWDRLPVPALGSGAVATGVAASADGAIVVGTIQSLDAQTPLLLSWDGSGLVEERIGDDGAVPPDGDASLTGVAVGEDGRAWAVGWRFADGRIAPLVVRRDAGGWTEIAVAGPEADTVLTAVVDDGTAVVAAGTRRVGDAWVPVTVRLDGDRIIRDLAGADASPGAITVPADLIGDGADPALVGQSYGPGDEVALPWATDGSIPVAAQSVLLDAMTDGTATWVTGTEGHELAAWVRCADGPWARFLPTGPGDDDASAEDGDGPAGDAEADGPMVAQDGEATGPAASRPPVDRGPWASRTAIVRDVGPEAGLAMTMLTWEAVASDLDGDGRIDLAIGGHGGPLALRRNVGGRFEPFPAEHGFVRRDRHGCAAGSVAGGPLPDLVCAIGAGKGTSIRLDEVWLDVAADAPPVDAAPTVGLVDPLSRGRRMLLLDADGDGDDDLYALPDAARRDGLPTVARYYRNDAGRFVSDGAAGLDRIGGGACGSVVDMDGDGRPDIVACDGSELAQPYRIRIELNRGGTFRTIDPGPALTSLSAASVAVGDLNADGRADIAISDGIVVRVALQEPDGTFAFTWQRRVNKLIGLATGDVDGDVDADLYVVVGGQPDRPDQLLLSAGDGRSFDTVTVPGVPVGSGESAVMADLDADGRDEILVLDGGVGPGPVRLLDVEPVVAAGTP